MKRILLLSVLIITLVFAFTSCGSTVPPDDTPPACSHEFGEWKVTAEASCLLPGSRMRTCNICDKEEIETIPATGHALNGAVCDNCGTLPLIEEWDASATEEDNITVKLWKISEKNYLIEFCGSGNMKDFSGYRTEIVDGTAQQVTDVPWAEYEESINHVIVSEDITHISSFALYRTNITSFTFPNCESIGNHGERFLSACYNLVEIFFPSDFLEYAAEGLEEPLPEMTNEEYEAKFAELSPHLLLNYFGSDYDIMTDFSNRVRRVSIDGWGSKITRDKDGFVFFENKEDVMLVNYEGENPNIVLPAKYNDRAYKTIDGLFFWDDTVKSIVFPDGLTELPDIMAGTELDSITIPSSISKICAHGPERLDKVYVSSIESFCNIENAFKGLRFYKNTELYIENTQIKSIVIPNSITEIKPYAFSGIAGLESVTIPDTVTAIGNSAFAGTTVSTVVMSGNIESIGAYAFSGTDITSITLTSTLKTIGQYAFSGTDLTKVVVPDSVLEIGIGVFANCTKLAKATLGDGITEVPMLTFGSCTSLVDIDLPDNCTYVSNLIFRYQNDNYLPDFTDFLIVDGWLINCTLEEGEITLPEGIVGVNLSGFKRSAAITKLTVPEGVKYICDYNIFKGLEEINIPSSIVSIGNRAFRISGANLLTVNVKSIDSWCGVSAVNRDENPTKPSFFNGIRQLKLFCDGEEVTEITLSNGTVKCGFLSGFSSITSVTIGEGVTAIEEGAFSLTNITTITLYNAGFADAIKDVETLETIYFIGTEEEWNEICGDIVFASSPTIVFSDAE
ncbi:MAG: leucine-rich repeat protein [Clostridia bacterium]|nr:leucine-rich repeat protein [Clostridia bacterium]